MRRPQRWSASMAAVVALHHLWQPRWRGSDRLVAQAHRFSRHVVHRRGIGRHYHRPTGHGSTMLWPQPSEHDGHRWTRTVLQPLQFVVVEIAEWSVTFTARITGALACFCTNRAIGVQRPTTQGFGALERAAARGGKTASSLWVSLTIRMVNPRQAAIHTDPANIFARVASLPTRPPKPSDMALWKAFLVGNRTWRFAAPSQAGECAQDGRPDRPLFAVAGGPSMPVFLVEHRGERRRTRALGAGFRHRVKPYRLLRPTMAMSRIVMLPPPHTTLTGGTMAGRLSPHAPNAPDHAASSRVAAGHSAE